MTASYYCDGGGFTDNKDVMALFRYTSGNQTVFVSVIVLYANGDSHVDNKDVVILFRFLSGEQITLFPAPYVPKG